MKQEHSYKIIIITVFFSSALISILSPMAIDIANALPDVSQSQVLITVSIFLAVSAAFSIIWALLDTKFDRKKLLIIATIDWTFFTFLTTFANNFMTLVIFQVCSAVGFGAILPLSYSAIVDFDHGVGGYPGQIENYVIPEHPEKFDPPWTLKFY